MAIEFVSKAFPSFFRTGDSTPSTTYSRSIAKGQTVVIAYGSSTTSGTYATLSSVSDSAGNSYTVYANPGSSSDGGVAVAYCRLTNAVTTNTVITFHLNYSGQDCCFIGYEVSGASGTRVSEGQRGLTYSTASLCTFYTPKASTLFVAVNYHRDYIFEYWPQAYSPSRKLDFFDPMRDMSLGLVARSVSSAGTYSAGLTYSASLPTVTAGVALVPYVAVVDGPNANGQIITMF